MLTNMYHDPESAAKYYHQLQDVTIKGRKYTTVDYPMISSVSALMPAIERDEEGPYVTIAGFGCDGDYFYDNAEAAKRCHKAEGKPKGLTNAYPISFDVETNPDGTCWHMQFTINNTIIICRTWEQTMAVFAQVEKFFASLTGINGCDCAFATILIANLGFEFQYLRKRLKWTSVFATASRAPLTADTAYMHFVDPLRLSNSGLGKLAEIYNLPTKKLKGALDYKVFRTSKTVLKAKERKYCINDVAVLGDFWDWCVEYYIKGGINIPLTSTGIVRDTVEKFFRAEAIDKVKRGNKTYNNVNAIGKNALEMKPETIDEYNELIRHCLWGGQTHANCRYVGQVVNDVNFVDFTSSYPFCVVFCKYPMTKFKDYRGKATVESIIAAKEDTATIAKYTFRGLRARTSHTYLSASKSYEYFDAHKSVKACVKAYNWLIDNGKIYAADKATYMLTELDLEIVNQYYTWESVEISNIKSSHKDYLPDYIRYAVLIYYQRKAELKRAGLDETTQYRICKAMVNAIYGMMCEKIHILQDECDCAADEAWYKSYVDEADLDIMYRCAIHGVRYIPTVPEVDYATMTDEEIVTYEQVQLETTVQRGKMLKKLERIEAGKELTNKPLSVYWAIYTTANARWNLMYNLYHIDTALYCDTDSIYYIVSPDVDAVVTRWNNYTHSLVKQVINEWNEKHGFDRALYDAAIKDPFAEDCEIQDPEAYREDTCGILIENVRDLGEFDLGNKHNNYSRFKTLGAKRYLKEEVDSTCGLVKTQQTIAGLPKTALVDYCKRNHIDPFAYFDDHMSIPGVKHTNRYIDSAYSTIVRDNQGNEEEMSELSAVQIYDIDFNMSLSSDFLALLMFVREVQKTDTQEFYSALREATERSNEV